MKAILLIILVMLQFCLVLLEAKAKDFKQFETPIMEKSVIVTDTGFYPEKVVVYSGTKIKLFVTATTERPSCLVVSDQNIFLPASRGEVTETEVYFEGTGEFVFHCPTGKIKGKFVVLEHPKERRARVQREVASRRKVKVWAPRDQ